MTFFMLLRVDAFVFFFVAMLLQLKILMHDDIYMDLI